MTLPHAVDVNEYDLDDHDDHDDDHDDDEDDTGLE